MSITRTELVDELRQVLSLRESASKFIRKRTKNDMIEQLLMLRGTCFNNLSFMEQCSLKQMNKSEILDCMLVSLG